MSGGERSEVSQALIAAGGFGRRMPTEQNPRNCKSLIEVAGQPLLGHLIDALTANGIDDLVVATDTHSDYGVREVLESKGIDDNKTVISGNGFRAIAYETLDLLDDRFFLACGHHAISQGHVARMLCSSDSSEAVITGYNNADYTMDKLSRIVVEDSCAEIPNLRYVNLEEEKISPSHVYIRNPFIVPRSIVARTKTDDFRYSFSHYVYRHWQNGGSLTVVDADMPPEFDYFNEFSKTIRYLGSLANIDTISP